MTTTRPIPDWLYEAASGRAIRIVGYRAATWLYGLDGIPTLQPEFAIAHGTRKRRPFDHQRRRIDDLDIVEVQGLLITSVPQTLVDLCAVCDLDIVERASESALRMHFVGELELRRARWEVAREHFRTAVTLARNPMERRFLQQRADIVR